ncbi:ZAP1 [Candida theae]|uniref:ZAP1 n=1 Tax=Candida theae TaxID=1198502 RepID=A0AAD5FZ45_9ASCO|nr:ZAP1 [Candida theae]KAI5959334.1 ZAP1 [Candida theae]
MTPTPQAHTQNGSSNTSLGNVVSTTTSTTISPTSQSDFTCSAVPSISAPIQQISDKKLIEMLEKGVAPESTVLTHGYVHGHIHKHKDHTHIHGHIHNHDHDHHYHQLQECVPHSTDFRSPNLQSGAGTSSFDGFCQEFSNEATCNEVFCDDLDDCFYLTCDDSKIIDEEGCCVGAGVDETTCCTDANCVPPMETHKCCEQAPPNVPVLKSQRSYQIPCCELFEKEHVSKLVCCEDPQCKDNKVCHSSPNEDRDCHRSSCHHSQGTLPELEKDNLCDLQTAKRPLFEDLISNVHQNLTSQENLLSQALSNPPVKKSKRNPSNDFQIHFPHECHPKDAKESSYHHHVHQSCFHTTIPNDPTSVYEDEKLMSDFDFIIKFNNFHDMMTKKAGLKQLSTSNDAESLLQYPCQWEHCIKKLNNDNFMNHLVGDHIKQEHDLEKATSYQCEWNNCNYTDENLDALLEHLETHKQSNQEETEFRTSSPRVLTPMSTTSVNEKSPLAAKSPTSTKPELNITSMSILPQKKKGNTTNKPACCAQGPEFRCEWEVGVDDYGKPIPCNATHESQCDLQHHIINDHIGSGQSKYTCNWIGCDRHNGKIFKQRQKLLRHIHVHTNYKPCKCSICGASFAVQSMLDQHLRVHSGEKPFQCSTCGKRFATSSSLSIHNRVHTGEKPLKCKWPGCNKSFSESSNLTKHIKTHERELVCVECGSAFSKKTDLEEHIRSHKEVDNGNLEMSRGDLRASAEVAI